MNSITLKEKPTVKQLAIVVIVSVALALLFFAQGCTSNDRVTAGTEGSITTPASATLAPPSGAAPPVSQPSDAAANGGSSLPAAAPYRDAGAPAAQNVNPTPFLVASQNAGPGGANSPPSNTLTSRADGTMSGPNDLPAASTGWGTSPAAAKPAAGAKPQTGRPAPK
jgi:hypothetical protein